MDYQYLKQGDGTWNLPITLTMAEVKLLHNAAVDMMKVTTADDNPTLTEIYKSVVEELNEIIVYHQNKLNPND